MVLDLGKDHYRLSGPALEALGRKAIQGNMEDVLRVYEEEMRVSTSRNDIRAKTASADGSSASSQNPIKNAIMGDLVRTLLIQVQKTKVFQLSMPVTFTVTL
jgi:nuclear-control-of-ATPase protein 2